MKPIEIRIDNARIESFTVKFQDSPLPEVSVTVGLYAGMKKVSTFSSTTLDYYENHFELPAGCVGPIVVMAKELEAVVTLACMESLALLPAPKGGVVHES